MMDLQTPLSERELADLDELLLHRPGHAEDDIDSDRDEGIIDVSELDGFMTAIVSGPDMITPSQWLPLVWGEVEPIWDSIRAGERAIGLMMRHMNGIAGTLLECPDEFEPVFLERTVDGETQVVVDEWCSGYVQGMMLSADAWADEAPESYELLHPIFLFGSDRGWAIAEGLEESEREAVRALVAPAARAIHAFWLSRRTPHTIPASRAAKIGRNAPCPCGSGRKFKRCCSN
jgi:uncharacterized protein